MDETPLAGLSAYLHTRRTEQGKVDYRVRLSFLDLPEHLVDAGKDRDGNEVYGLWTRAEPILVRRLVEAFLSLNNVPADDYEIRRVSHRGRLALISFFFRHGLYIVARKLLARWEGLTLRHLTPAPGID
ncbi:MAG: hypothetical protein RDV00_06590 [Clostridia bacterium]|nr:hypothetical protein [Clostridia bacterium]MDQ7791768.1 hypothetical protein [Clostridia bacterium]